MRKFKFIGCEIVYREACFLAASGEHCVDVEFLRKGLHDLERADMTAKIQATIDAVDPSAGYEAILLGYARCNDGLVGVQARGIPLVIPKAHDCITFFFGSRHAYRAAHAACPGTYFASSGWVERDRFSQGQYTQPAYGKTGVMANLGLTESYEDMVAKYGRENADFILEQLGGWEKNYSRCLYLEMGVCDETAFVDDTRRMAEAKHWTFERHKGDLSLLQRLFAAQWDADFVLVAPGQTLAARNDEEILEAR